MIVSDINVDTSSPGTYAACIKAQTLGKVEAVKVNLLEVCGNEEVIIDPSANPIIKMDAFSRLESPTTSLEIIIDYVFSSSSQACHLTSFKLVSLVNGLYTDYEDTNLVL